MVWISNSMADANRKNGRGEIAGELRTRYTRGYLVPFPVDPVFFADRAARTFFDQVANKGAVMIVTISSERPARFNEMKRRLEGVRHKALTQALRRLKRNGLIARRVLATSPAAVEYSLTPLGHSLQTPFRAVYDWSIEHRDELEDAKRFYDERQSDCPPMES